VILANSILQQMLRSCYPPRNTEDLSQVKTFGDAISGLRVNRGG
jgi:hypothetical protein